MSQSSFLEDVVSWSEKECQQRQEEAVPKLVSSFKQAENYHGEIGVLKILCQCFVPCMDWRSLERCIFREITQQTCASYSHVIEDVKLEVSSPGNSQAKENVETLFELLLDVLDCVEGTVRYIQGADNSVELGHIHSLQLLTLHLLKTTFGHCKESGEIYKDLITALSDPLSVLFKKAYSLQMTFLSLLDKLSVGFTVSEEDIEDLTAVCDGLYGIIKLVTTLDVKIAVTLWKAISRYVTQHKVLLKERMDLAGMVVYLCAEVQRGYTYLFTLAPQVDQFGQVSGFQGDEKAFMKSLKILGFQMKVLVMLVKEYEGYLADCERPLYILLLHLHRMQPPSLSAPVLQKSHQEEIHRHLLNATEPIMSHLMECSRFITCLTGNETDGASDTALAHLLLQTTTLSLLPQLSDDVHEKWLIPSQYSGDEPRQGIIDAIFTACEQCHTELLLGGSLPGVMCSGKPQRFVSLYEHVCTRLCGYVGSLSAKQFPVLESSLLRHVVNPDPLCSQLATDVWCFVARYGSADLCLSHVTMLGQMVQSAPPTQTLEYRTVLRLLGRLTKFMAAEHQENLLDLFPPEGSLYVWSALPLSDFPVPLQTQILNNLLPKCTRYLSDWNGKSERKFSELKNLNSALEVLCNIFKHEAGVQGGMDSSLTQSLMQEYCRLWSCLPDLRDPNCRASSLCHQLVSHCLELGSHVIKHLPPQVFHQVVELSSKMLQENCTVELKLSICQLLHQAGKVKLPPTAEQTPILCCVSQLFSILLTDAHCLVQHSACQAYSSFSQESMHEIPVPECLQADPILQDKLSRHLYQIGLLEMESERNLELLRSLKTALEKFKQMAPGESILYTTTMPALEDKSCTSTSEGNISVDVSDTKMEEPAAKKLKLDLSCEQSETDFGKLLDDTSRCIHRWVELLRAEQVPHGILNELRRASKDLSEAVSNHHDHG